MNQPDNLPPPTSNPRFKTDEKFTPFLDKWGLVDEAKRADRMRKISSMLQFERDLSEAVLQGLEGDHDFDSFSAGEEVDQENFILVSIENALSEVEDSFSSKEDIPLIAQEREDRLSK